ncbi:MAG TPA: hypothetical protein VGU66_16750 [Candidatus Elarobacter sp.]|nr:hypothetical protein [Candidatus Elarobacter sp.]
MRPRDDDKVWRYMSLSKYLSLISTGNLYFARADLPGDRFEGAIGVSNSRAAYSPPPSIRGTTAQRERVYISCWHQQPHELAAMWSVYGVLGESIAIRSTFAVVVQALPSSVVVGRVKYADYLALPLEAYGDQDRYFYKRRSFRTDRELRAIEFKDGGRKNPGLTHPVDLRDFVEAVYVAPGSPDFFRNAVRDVTRRYDINAPARTPAPRRTSASSKRRNSTGCSTISNCKRRRRSRAVATTGWYVHHLKH